MATPIKTFLHSLLQKEASWKVKLLQSWPSVIGKLHTKVKLEKIQETTLVLSVADSCWLQELYLLSPVLLKTINEKLDRPRIKRLRFKQAGIKEKKKKKAAPKRKKSVKQIQLNKTEQQALHKIDDKQLSALLEKFLKRCHQEKE